VVVGGSFGFGSGSGGGKSSWRRAGGVAERRRLSVTPLKNPDMYRQTILVPAYKFL
jgi:hypothetical protein